MFITSSEESTKYNPTHKVGCGKMEFDCFYCSSGDRYYWVWTSVGGAEVEPLIRVQESHAPVIVFHQWSKRVSDYLPFNPLCTFEV